MNANCGGKKEKKMNMICNYNVSLYWRFESSLRYQIKKTKRSTSLSHKNERGQRKRNVTKKKRV